MLYVEINNDYVINFIDNTKVFRILFGGNLDLYWQCYDYNQNDENAKVIFEITKDNYLIYELFNELYHNIKNCHIFKVNNLNLSFCHNREDEDSLYKEVTYLNNIYKNSEIYKRIFDGNQITWISDDERFNLLTITPSKDKYILEFTPGKESIYLDNLSIRFRNSGSYYHPFNILFMDMYNKIISGDYDLNQLHINDYMRRVKNKIN